MRTFLKVIFTLSLLFMLSCAIGALKKEELDLWFKTISGNNPPEINIAGKWHDAKGNYKVGWGEGYLRQKENKISGAIGNYNVKGVVSGKKVYLVFLYGGFVYYTASLELLEEDLLVGNYFEANDKKQKNGYPISLAKTRKEE